MTRRIAVATIAAIWMLAGFVSFVPISLSLHRPEQPLVFEDKDGKEFPTCALDLTPTYAVVSSCISFYVCDPLLFNINNYVKPYCIAGSMYSYGRHLLPVRNLFMPSLMRILLMLVYNGLQYMDEQSINLIHINRSQSKSSSSIYMLPFYFTLTDADVDSLYCYAQKVAE